MLPPVAALNSVTLIGLADDDDMGLSVATVRSAGGSGSDGEESGNNELKHKKGQFNMLL